MNIIESQALTTCEVAADGKTVLLGFLDSAGRPHALRLSVNQVGALAMTIPALLEKALRTRYADHSLRYAYPLASWAVEHSSDPATGIVTLSTVDGFRICFSMPRRRQDELGKALADCAAPDLPQLMN
jgi:hypothetical protein